MMLAMKQHAEQATSEADSAVGPIIPPDVAAMSEPSSVNDSAIVPRPAMW